jgi:hypothetical protein
MTRGTSHGKGQALILDRRAVATLPLERPVHPALVGFVVIQACPKLDSDEVEKMTMDASGVSRRPAGGLVPRTPYPYTTVILSGALSAANDE